MSAREPRDPRPNREQRRKHPPADGAFDVNPAQREQRRTRGREDGGFDELPGQQPAELGIARIATSQNGAVTHAQLTETGLGHSGIGRRSDRGLLHRIHRGVYVVGHEAFAPHAREAAALLAVGEQTVVSHLSAAVLWGLAAAGAHDIDVMVIGRRPRRRPGLHLHYASTVDLRDIRRLHGLPVTAPARTLFDLAATGYPKLERAFGEAHAQRLVTAREIEELLERAGPAPAPAHSGRCRPTTSPASRDRRQSAYCERSSAPPTCRRPGSTLASPAMRSTPSGPTAAWSSRSMATPTTATAPSSSATAARTLP